MTNKFVGGCCHSATNTGLAMEHLTNHSFGCMRTIFTIGHSTRTFSELIASLREVRIERLVDVRSFPRSRTNPQFNVDVLPKALAEAGVDYRQLPSLGGRRKHRKDAMPSPNTLWRNTSFRNYADYAGTEAFRSGLKQLETLSRDKRCAIMCAEAVWWRCHRRIIADYLLADGIPVVHLMGHDKLVPAKVTPGARRLLSGALVYTAAENAPSWWHENQGNPCTTEAVYSPQGMAGSGIRTRISRARSGNSTTSQNSVSRKTETASCKSKSWMSLLALSGHCVCARQY